jgi:hypothetical protein
MTDTFWRGVLVGATIVAMLGLTWAIGYDQGVQHGVRLVDCAEVER